MTDLLEYLPLNNENCEEAYNHLFSPWARRIGLSQLEVSTGRASAVLPQNEALQFLGGAISGQAIMAAIDMVAVLAMLSTERMSKGTASQNTQFLRSAVGEDLLINTEVLKFGKLIAYAETKVTFVDSKELVAHATCEFVF